MQHESLVAAAECLKVLAHPHRLKLLILLREGGMVVGELAKEVGIQSHVTSEHLRHMTKCGFLRSRREGRNVYYELAEPHLIDLLACVEARFGKYSKEKNGKHIERRVQKEISQRRGETTHRRPKSG